MQLLVVSEITVDDGSTIVLLAVDRPGYASLCRLVTRSDWHCTLEPLRAVPGEVPLHAFGAPPPDPALSFWEGAVRRADGAEVREGSGRSRLGAHRRSALWQTRALARRRHDSVALRPDEPLPLFAPLGEFETIAWDYQAAGHSPRGHPSARCAPSSATWACPTPAACRG